MKTVIIIIFLLATIQLLSVDTIPETKINFKDIDVCRDQAFTDIDGDGLFDLVVGTLDGKLFHYEQCSPNCSSPHLVTEDFGNFGVNFYSSPTFIDVDNDGLLDMFIGEYSGNIWHYKQEKSNSYSFTLVTKKFSYIEAGRAPNPIFIDLDGDKLLDLIIGTLNDNLIHFEQDEINSTSFSHVTDDFSGIEAGHYLTPTFTNIDNNGLIDLVIGSLNRNFLLYEQVEKNSTSFSLRKTGIAKIGSEFYSRPTMIDLDNNGLLNVVVGSANGNISHFEQKRINEQGGKPTTQHMQVLNKKNYENKLDISEAKLENEFVETPKNDAQDKETIEDIESKGVCTECKLAKIELVNKTAEFESVRTKMAGKISKEEYNELYEKYKSTWSEITKIKKKISELDRNYKNEYIAIYNEALQSKQLEDYDDALELLEEAISLKPDFDEAYYQIVSIYIVLEEDSEVDRYIEKISDKEKKGKMYYRRAMAIKDSYPKKAISYLQRMSELYNPELAFYHMGFISVTMLSDSKTAIDYLEKSLKRNSKDPKVLDLIGAVYLDMEASKGQNKNKNIEKSIEYFKEAVLNGDNYKKLDFLFSRLAQAYNRLGKSGRALFYADLALSQLTVYDSAVANLEKGKALIKTNKSPEAKVFLERAKDDPMTAEEAKYWLNRL